MIPPNIFPYQRLIMDPWTARQFERLALIYASWGSCSLIFWYQVATFVVNLEEFAVRFVLNRLFRFQCCQVSDSTFQNHFSPFHEIEELAPGFLNGSLWLILISHIIWWYLMSHNLWVIWKTCLNIIEKKRLKNFFELFGHEFCMICECLNKIDAFISSKTNYKTFVKAFDSFFCTQNKNPIYFTFYFHWVQQPEVDNRNYQPGVATGSEPNLDLWAYLELRPAMR